VTISLDGGEARAIAIWLPAAGLRRSRYALIGQSRPSVTLSCHQLCTIKVNPQHSKPRVDTTHLCIRKILSKSSPLLDPPPPSKTNDVGKAPIHSPKTTKTPFKCTRQENTKKRQIQPQRPCLCSIFTPFQRHALLCTKEPGEGLLPLKGKQRER
jgi:hypothetical protein